MNKFYVGDPAFTKKMMKIYQWILPIVFLFMSILLVVTNAWISAILFGIAFLLTFPCLKDFFAKFKIYGMAKLILCIVFVYFGLYLTIFYV